MRIYEAKVWTPETREPLLAAEVDVNADNKRLTAERDSLKTQLAKQIDVWDVERKAMEAQLAAMTAARDAACDLAASALGHLQNIRPYDYRDDIDRIAELRAVGKVSK